MISARFALAAARHAAGLGEEGRLAERLTAIEAGQEAILAALEAEATRAEHERSEQGIALDRLAGAITALAARIDIAAARSETMAETLVETMAETLAGTVAQAAEETAARLAELAAFRETVGLTIAEFLAETRAPQRGADAGPGPAVQLTMAPDDLSPRGDLTPDTATPQGPRQTLAMRLAARNRQRELRAERLARLRPPPGPGLKMRIPHRRRAPPCRRAPRPRPSPRPRAHARLDRGGRGRRSRTSSGR